MLSLWTELQKSWPHKGFFMESFDFHAVNFKKQKKVLTDFLGFSCFSKLLLCPKNDQSCISVSTDTGMALNLNWD